MPTRSDIHADAFLAARRWLETMSPRKERAMKTLIVATAAAVLLGASLTQAATNRTSNVKAGSHSVLDTSLSSDCARLADQFDHAEGQHKANQNYQQAVALSVEGKTLCSGNKGAAGIDYLTSAIKMIGMEPNS
jgi:hypothetical protein